MVAGYLIRDEVHTTFPDLKLGSWDIGRWLQGQGRNDCFAVLTQYRHQKMAKRTVANSTFEIVQVLNVGGVLLERLSRRGLVKVGSFTAWDLNNLIDIEGTERVDWTVL
jgi:hypothetical protein